MRRWTLYNLVREVASADCAIIGLCSYVIMCLIGCTGWCFNVVTLHCYSHEFVQVCFFCILGQLQATLGLLEKVCVCVQVLWRHNSVYLFNNLPYYGQLGRNFPWLKSLFYLFILFLYKDLVLDFIKLSFGQLLKNLFYCRLCTSSASQPEAMGMTSK